MGHPVVDVEVVGVFELVVVDVVVVGVCEVVVGVVVVIGVAVLVGVVVVGIDCGCRDGLRWKENATKILRNKKLFLVVDSL